MIERTHHLGEELNQAAPIVGRARPVVCLVRNAGLAEDRQVSALGQVLAQQPVAVVAGSALPEAVMVAEASLDASVLGQLLVPAHLLTLVVGPGLPHRLGNRVELGGEGLQCRGCCGVFYLGQQDQPRPVIHQHRHTPDQAPPPGGWHHAILHFGRVYMDTGYVRDLPAPVRVRRTRLVRAIALAQAGNEVAHELASCVRVDGAADSLVRDLRVGLVGPLVRQRPRDLLRRSTPAQASLEHEPQLQIRVQLALRAGSAAALRAGHLCILHHIGLRRAVALQLTAQRADAAVQGSGASAQAVYLLSQARQRHPLLGMQRSVFRFPRHVRTLSGGKVLHFVVETANQVCLYISRET